MLVHGPPRPRRADTAISFTCRPPDAGSAIRGGLELSVIPGSAPSVLLRLPHALEEGGRTGQAQASRAVRPQHRQRVRGDPALDSAPAEPAHGRARSCAERRRWHPRRPPSMSEDPCPALPPAGRSEWRVQGTRSRARRRAVPFSPPPLARPRPTGRKTALDAILRATPDGGPAQHRPLQSAPRHRRRFPSGAQPRCSSRSAGGSRVNGSCGRPTPRKA